MHDDSIDPRKEKLVAFLYGELPDAEARQIEQMLANDLDLRGEFEELREMKGFLGEWDVEEKEPSFVLVGAAAAGASRGRGANVFEGPGVDAGRRGVFARVAASRAWWGLAAAACLLLALGASGLRVQRLDGGVAFRFGAPPSSGLSSGSSSGAATDVALTTESGFESGLTAFDNAASRSGSEGLLADSRPNPAGELVTASNQIVTPHSGAAPAGGQTPYMTRQEFESYSEGMSKMFIALLKDYGASRDAKLTEAMQAMSEGFTDQQFKDYQELRKRIEAIHVGLAADGVAGDAKLGDVLDENGAGVSRTPRNIITPDGGKTAMTRHLHDGRGARHERPGEGTRRPRAIAATSALRALGPAALAVCVLALVLAFIFAVASAFAQPAAQSPAEPNRRIHRSIAVMERALDEMLVDSPNLLVSGRENARGTYIDGFGALFTFDASLINKDWDFDFDFDEDWGKFDFEVKDEGDKIVIYRGKGKDREKLTETKRGPELVWEENEDAEAPDAPDAAVPKARALAEREHEKAERAREEIAHARRNSRKLAQNRDEKLYERGKQEMVDFLLDYGDAIDGLRDEQTIEFVAYFREHEYFAARDFSHFSVRAKVGDLRAYASGALSEAAMTAKIVQVEY